MRTLPSSMHVLTATLAGLTSPEQRWLQRRRPRALRSRAPLGPWLGCRSGRGGALERLQPSPGSREEPQEAASAAALAAQP